MGLRSRVLAVPDVFLIHPGCAYLKPAMRAARASMR
jgi:hypothetical protein